MESENRGLDLEKELTCSVGVFFMSFVLCAPLSATLWLVWVGKLDSAWNGDGLSV